MNILYALQNTGGIRMTLPVGDAIPVRYTLRGLAARGHTVRLAQLRGRVVSVTSDFSSFSADQSAAAGVSGTKGFQWLESAARRFQKETGMPYFAAFDSLRFYENCLRLLPPGTICHEHNALFSVGALLAARRRRAPYVLTFSADPIFELEVVGRPLHGAHKKAARWAAAYTYRGADAIICVSEAARRHLIEEWDVDRGKIKVMPNGVDLALFGQANQGENMRARHGLGNVPVIMFVGAFQPWHGLDFLVRAFAQLRAVAPAARLVLVGDGPARPQVEEEISSLGLNDAVMITGRVPHERVPDWLAAADAAILPYPRLPKELWFSPLKLYEYMAAGCAIIASRAGQISKVIADGETGLLAEPGVQEEWVSAMSRLLGDEVLRAKLGRNARAAAEANHSWERYLDRLEAIYERVSRVDMKATAL